jgi:hypothetical protein
MTSSSREGKCFWKNGKHQLSGGFQAPFLPFRDMHRHNWAKIVINGMRSCRITNKRLVNLNHSNAKLWFWIYRLAHVHWRTYPSLIVWISMFTFKKGFASLPARMRIQKPMFIIA